MLTPLEAYIQRLKTHDWYYDFSDDYSAYKRGQASLSELVAMRKKLDPDYAVWNQHAPQNFKIPT